MAGVEVSNGYRVATYVTNVGVPGATMDPSCQCPQLDDGFDTPLIDPAPWYEPTRPESADFLGFWMNQAVLQPVAGRSVSQNGRRSSSLSPMSLSGRILQAQGLMMARSAEGQAYGERWLTEVLRGSPCNEGDCPSDDLIILPACPELEGYDGDRYFRTLVNVGLIDGPIFSPVVNAESKLQQVAFTLASTQPWLYHPATRCLEDEILADYYASQVLSCSLTTPEWMGEGTFRIELENIGVADATNITITGQISLDGGCPVSGLGTSVPPSWSYTVPTLAPEDKLVIDGMRRQVLHWDASEKFYRNGLSKVEFDSRWRWPDVGVCSTMCLSIDIQQGEVSTTVDSILREL